MNKQMKRYKLTDKKPAFEFNNTFLINGLSIEFINEISSKSPREVDDLYTNALPKYIKDIDILNFNFPGRTIYESYMVSVDIALNASISKDNLPIKCEVYVLPIIDTPNGTRAYGKENKVVLTYNEYVDFLYYFNINKNE